MIITLAAVAAVIAAPTLLPQNIRANAKNLWLRPWRYRVVEQNNGRSIPEWRPFWWPFWCKLDDYWYNTGEAANKAVQNQIANDESTLTKEIRHFSYKTN